MPRTPNGRRPGIPVSGRLPIRPLQRAPLAVPLRPRASADQRLARAAPWRPTLPRPHRIMPPATERASMEQDLAAPERAPPPSVVPQRMSRASMGPASDPSTESSGHNREKRLPVGCQAPFGDPVIGTRGVTAPAASDAAGQALMRADGITRLKQCNLHLSAKSCTLSSPPGFETALRLGPERLPVRNTSREVQVAKYRS